MTDPLFAGLLFNSIHECPGSDSLWDIFKPELPPQKIEHFSLLFIELYRQIFLDDRTF